MYTIFFRYLTLKNVWTMKSSLGITHPADLCTIAETYRLLLPKSFKGHWNWYQSGKPVSKILL